MRLVPDLPADRITIVPSTTAPATRTPLHDARSPYVEQFWAGILGPSATLLLRHINNEFDASTVGFVLHYDEVARQLGVGGTGRNSPFYKALQRLCAFGLAELTAPNRLSVATKVPTLSRALTARLPDTLRQRHDYLLKVMQPLESA